MSGDLGWLLGEVEAVLLDFDGPVCSIFAEYPAPRVAAELVDVLYRCGVDVPPDLASEPDPLEVLRHVGSAGDHRITRVVEDALCAAERRAIATAEPTPYGREVIVAARQAGLLVAAVSNNSAGAVTAYLTEHRLIKHMASIIGRAYAEPTRMKPNPEPILKAVHAMNTPASRCVLVGDSLTDVEGARAAGVLAIGYANREPKVQALRAAGADAVITSMGELAQSLVAFGGRDGGVDQ